MSEPLSDERLAEIRAAWAKSINPGGISDTRHALGDCIREVDRLRALIQPDPSEEKELAAIRDRLSRNAYRPDLEWRRPSESGVRWSDMVHYLLERLTATQGILADALSESGARQAGAAEERRRCLAALEAERDHWPNGMPSFGEKVFECFVGAVEALPPLPDPLPPESSRARADAMECRAGELKQMLQRLMEATPEGVKGTIWHALKAEARKLLGEG